MGDVRIIIPTRRAANNALLSSPPTSQLMCKKLAIYIISGAIQNDRDQENQILYLKMLGKNSGFPNSSQ